MLEGRLRPTCIVRWTIQYYFTVRSNECMFHLYRCCCSACGLDLYFMKIPLKQRSTSSLRHSCQATFPRTWELLQMLLQTWTWSTCVLGYQLSSLWCRREGSCYIFWVMKNCCKKGEAISNTTDADITYAQRHPGLAQLGMEFSQIHLHALFGLCPNGSRPPAHMGTQRMRHDFTSRQTWQLLSSQK